MVTINTLNGGNIVITTGGSAPAGHADTWVKWDGDTEWTPVSIEGEEIAFTDGMPDPTGQVENPFDIVAIEIGTDVTSIGAYGFAYCEKLASITIPNSVTSIGDHAFEYCSGLTNVTIPNSVTNIGISMFEYCPGLTSVIFQGKTIEQVQNIEDEYGDKWYPWGISNTSIISVA